MHGCAERQLGEHFRCFVSRDLTALGQHRPTASMDGRQLSVLWERVITGGTPLRATTVRKWLNAVPRVTSKLMRAQPIPSGPIAARDWDG